MSCENSVEVPVCGVKLSLDTSGIEAGLSREEVQGMIDQSMTTMPAGDGISYSLEEQWTGKYWIDGKKIYQKTVVFNKTCSKDVQYSIPHNINKIGTILFLTGSCTGLTNKKTGPLPSVSTYTQSFFGVSSTDTNILLKAHIVNWEETEFRITLQYTCTDR